VPQPVPEDIVRVQMNFLLGTEELAVASFHLHLNHEPGANTNWAEMVQTAAEKTRDKWRAAFGQTERGLFPTAVVLRDVAAYHLRASDGHALDKGSAIASGGSAWAGSATRSLPLECAAAVSFFGYPQGAFVRDRARRRGRMYLPPLAIDVMDDSSPGRAGRMGAGQANTLATAVGAFFNDIEGMSVGQDPLDIGQTWSHVIVSRAGNFFSPVTRVAVGDVVDVQRRRRNSQNEFYRSVDIQQA
jgi:hypothetical protein